jgi:hypothetical protein
MASSGTLARMVSAIVVSGLLAGTGLAQELTESPIVQHGNALVLGAVEHDLTMPLPDWLSPAERLGGDVIDQVVASYRADASQALLEIYPKGENEEQWRTLYGARITLQADRPLDDYRSAVMYGYSQSCKPELTGFFKFGEDDGDVLAPLGFVCGAYLDNLKSYAGQGEVMVMSFHKTEKGSAIVYQEWRGQAFDPSDPNTWPVEANVLKVRAEQLKSGAALALAD